MTGDRNLWRTTRPFLPVLLTLLLLSGCSAWDNVSAYFNTYYNASRVYQEAVAEVWALPELKSAGGDPLVPFTIAAGTKTKFTSVIEKCSKLLQYHPESGLVDNSLMMIGMSSFYQADYQRGQRKFLELIEAYPDGDYAMEARLMLARTAFKVNERQRARDLSTQLLALAEEEGEDEIAAHAAGILGRLSYEDGQFEDARKYFEIMAEGAGNADLRSSAYLRVATIDSVLGDYGPARDSYERAENSAVNIGAEYKGAIGAARMESFLGDYRDALERLDDMGTNSSFRESYGEIALEVGHVLRRSGELEDAIEQYRFVDTAFVRSEASGSALYALGQIYETQLYDFDSARVMYNKARIALPVTSILAQPVVRRAEAMNKWYSLRNEIVRYDSVLAFIDSAEAARKAAPPDTSAVADTASARTDSIKAPVPAPAPAGMPRDTVQARLAMAMTELATVHFLTLETLDSASVWYLRVLDEYPDSRGAPRSMFA
ncbi:MAG: repeat-containing protein, partial [Bacteroidetes bacterium]|nr:repeat-containing protein [Bacteroidota bacterium]